MSIFVYAGVRRRSDRRAAVAGAVVTAQSALFALDGFRCPLADAAERLGAEHAAVADIYPSRWIEDHLPLITGPIFLGAALLHTRNILSRRHLPKAIPTISRPCRTSLSLTWSPAAQGPRRAERYGLAYVSLVAALFREEQVRRLRCLVERMGRQASPGRSRLKGSAADSVAVNVVSSSRRLLPAG